MYLSKDQKRVTFRAVGIVFVLISLLFTAGCDILDVFAPISTVNLLIPLGLGGGTGLLNPPSGLSLFGIPLNDSTTNTVPAPIVGTSQ